MALVTKPRVWRLFRAAAVACTVLGAARTASSAPPTNTRDEIACRASSGVGYSYWWGGGCWCQSGCGPDFGSCSAGSCSGSCPSCSHSGSYGADCSGFVNKVWQVPDAISTSSCGHGNYVAASYTSGTSYWSVISRDSLLKGDVLASSSHVAVYDQGDPWGSMAVWEARGCSYGIVHNWRTFSSSYSAARRINIEDTSSCICTPGETEIDACGDCGWRQRTCLSSCEEWGSWSSCQDEGTCSPGATESRACNQCGVETRTCGGSCQWNSWSACEDVDPGNDVCDTYEQGPCAAGRLTCSDGTLDCVRDYEPSPELCDAVDNDCDGSVDNGFPGAMGETPPPYAAALRDYQVPLSAVPGETVQVRASFENLGASAWLSGQVRLIPMSAVDGTSSDIYADDDWPAWNAAAVTTADIPPGDVAAFEFSFVVPEDAPSRIIEEFRLSGLDGALMKCPNPSLTVDIWIEGGTESDDPTGPGSGHPRILAGGCDMGGASGPSAPLSPWLLLLLFAGLGLREKHVSGRGAHPRHIR